MYIPKELRAPLAMQFLVFGLLLTIFGMGISHNANELKTSVYASCTARAAIEQRSNELLDTLIDNAANSSVFSPAEKAERINGWRAVRRTSEFCVRL